MGKTHAWNSVHSRARCRQHGIELGVTVTQTIKSCYTLLGTLWQKPIHSGVSLFWRVDFFFRPETSLGIDVCVSPSFLHLRSSGHHGYNGRHGCSCLCIMCL